MIRHANGTSAAIGMQIAQLRNDIGGRKMSKPRLLLLNPLLVSAGAALLFVCAIPSRPMYAAEKSWMTLFNGKDLSGWTITAAEVGHESTWQVKDGIIECGQKGGSWLRSNEEYEDFILSLEYKISPGGNSGIFIRSSEQGNPAFTGMEVQILDDYGKPPERHSAGAIYASVAPTKNMSRPPGEWNKVTIFCIGRRVIDIMNEEKIVDANLDDYTAPLENHSPLSLRLRRGFIGLQNYGNPAWFRDIKIKPLSTSEKAWVELFNGKDLSRWVVMGKSKEAFYGKDGVIECNGKGGFWLRTEKEYEDFLLDLEFRISKGGNSGIFIRSAEAGNPAYSGMEIQILDDNGKAPNTHSTGCIYAAVAPNKNLSKPPGEWNHILIGCLGRNVFIVMNGESVVDINLDDYGKPLEKHSPLKERLPKGYIGLQDHGSPVSFRNIRIKEIE
jgi:hypothetical protein